MRSASNSGLSVRIAAIVLLVLAAATSSASDALDSELTPLMGTWDLYPEQEPTLTEQLSWGPADVYWYFGFWIDNVESVWTLHVVTAAYSEIVEAQHTGDMEYQITLENEARPASSYRFHLLDTDVMWIEPVDPDYSVFQLSGPEFPYHRRS